MFVEAINKFCSFVFTTDIIWNKNLKQNKQHLIRNIANYNNNTALLLLSF